MASNEGYGFLYPIKPEDKKENGPALSGTAMLHGKEVKIAAWTKKAQSNGTKYLNLKFEDFEVDAAEDGPADDLPF